RFELAADESLAQPPRMLDAERIDRLMLELPRDNRLPDRVPGDDARDESPCRREQLGVRFRRDQRTFPERRREVVLRHENLGLAEVLDGADPEDDLLARALGGLELPVELAALEGAVSRLDAVPVGGEADHLERIRQQLIEGRAPVKAERLDLARPKADP